MRNRPKFTWGEFWLALTLGSFLLNLFAGSKLMAGMNLAVALLLAAFLADEYAARRAEDLYDEGE